MFFITLSVHDIVDLFLRKGHLDTRIFNISSMLEGTKIHKMYQMNQGSNYQAEYYLASEFLYKNFRISVSGRADGLIIEDNKYIIEEIKSTVSSLEQFISDHGQWHLGQAMFYAYMLAKEKSLSSVDIRMTYINQLDIKEIKKINQTFKYADLELFVNNLIAEYVEFYNKIYTRKMERDKFVNSAIFPFSKYRTGQKEMINFVTKQVSLSASGYIEAPTGIGKTISILYPTIKSLKYNKINSLLYLTNKNSIKKIAVDNIKLFEKQNSKLKTIQFTSKDNICPNENKKKCNPDDCFFARYYYDKLNDAIKDALEESNVYSEEFIRDFSLRKEMCPYQFQHDLSRFCDILICDYNYVFDINDFLSFSEISDSLSKSILCIDEVHNLPTRVKEMYSIELSIDYIDNVISHVMSKNLSVIRKNISKLYDLINNINIDENKLKNKIVYELDNLEDTFSLVAKKIISEFKKILKSDPLEIGDALLDFYFRMLDLDKLLELISGDFRKYFNIYLIYQDKKILSFNIQNIVSKEIIKMKTQRFYSTIYFSATLSPKDYYIDLLGGDINNKDEILVLPSPFTKENRRIFIDTRYSLYYKDRNTSLPYIHNLIKDAISSKIGNYFVFVPSFEYLYKLKECFSKDNSNIKFHYQNPYMNEKDRSYFLASFKKNTKTTNVGVLVLGGIFSEGIDLIGDRLIGAIIISAGISTISYNLNKEADYYNSINNKNEGFNYAYVYPGINKILQAAGRVIRSEDDKGFILFCDSRFKNENYRKIFKELYPDLINLKSNEELKNNLNDFFNKDRK